MRTLVTILLISLMLIGGSMISHQFIRKTSQTLETHLQSIEGSLTTQKWDSARNELTTLQKDWREDSTWWAILIDHQDIDTINISMMLLEKHLEVHNLSDSLSEVTALQLRFQQIYDSERLTIKNIL